MTEHAIACLVEEHAVWTKRGLEQGKGEVNRIEKGVFVNMFACIAGSVSHYKGCPFCVVYRLIFTFTGKFTFSMPRVRISVARTSTGVVAHGDIPKFHTFRFDRARTRMLLFQLLIYVVVFIYSNRTSVKNQEINLEYCYHMDLVVLL